MDLMYNSLFQVYLIFNLQRGVYEIDYNASID